MQIRSRGKIRPEKGALPQPIDLQKPHIRGEGLALDENAVVHPSILGYGRMKSEFKTKPQPANTVGLWGIYSYNRMYFTETMVDFARIRGPNHGH